MIPHILIVDDDPTVCRILTGMLRELGYTFGTAFDGREALKKMEHERYNILFVDLQMPNLDGRELIDITNRDYPNIVSIVLSATFNPEDVRKTLNNHKAFDYLKKPITIEELKKTIERAFELYTLRCISQTFPEDEMHFYREALDIFNWKTELRTKHTDYLSHDVIRQLNISFNQGSGVGTMLSLLCILFSQATFEEERNGFFVPKDLFILLQQNYDNSLGAISCLSRAQAILTQTEKYTDLMSIAEFTSFLEEIRAELIEILDIKNQRLSMGKMPYTNRHNTFICNREKMKTALNELLINAMKYSDEFATIIMLVMIRDNYLEIKILNPVSECNSHGTEISGKDEMLVFEPFYRISNVMDDRYDMQEFGHGLGLSVVRRIMDLHEAAIYMHTIKNHLNPQTEKNVCATLRFLLQNDTPKIEPEQKQIRSVSRIKVCQERISRR